MIALSRGYNTALDALERAKGIFSLDGVNYLRQDKSTKLNSLVGFDRLLHIGRHAAIRVAIFTSAPCYTCAFSMVTSGGERLRSLVSICQSVNPLLCRHPHTFDSVKGGFKTISKDSTMAKVRQAFTRPITSIPLRTHSTLAQASRHVEALIMRNEYTRFNIQQTPDGFVVGRVA